MEYKHGPDSFEQEGVPRGSVKNFIGTVNSTEKKQFVTIGCMCQASKMK